jgi:peptidoglycan hydrolase-like protein with peptidoglycan-binding domain
MILSFEEFNRSLNEGFFDWLSGLFTSGEEQPKNSDKSQTDVQDSVIADFYKTLQDFADAKKSIPVESYGNMKYSKTVEDIQTALTFLGYPLPKYGVDGYFGPETAAAIAKFNDDNPSTKAGSLKKTDTNSGD